MEAQSQTFQEGRILKTIQTKSNSEVIFQTISGADLSLLLNFINDLTSEDTFIYRESDKPITLEEEKVWLETALGAMKREEHFYFLAKMGGKVIGVCSIERGWMRERFRGTFRFSILKEYREQGIGNEMTKLGIEVAETMGLKILVGWVFADDEKAQYLAKKMGFIESGRLPQSVSFKDGFIDQVLLYRMLDKVYTPNYGNEAQDQSEEVVEMERTEEDIV